jgi:hypothetical protein
MKIALALLLTLTLMTAATAGQRCRSTTMGSTTYTECDGPNGKTRCRASRSGTTVYTSCR